MEKEYNPLKLENQLCFPLYACSKEVVKRYKPFLDKLDLTYTQYITMMVMWEKKSINVKELGDAWKRTKLYETLSAPQFQEFRNSLRRQIDEAWPNRLGLNVDDFTTLPSGEIGGGLIAVPGKKPGFAVMMNVDGNASEVNEFLVRLIRQTTEKQQGEATKERIAAANETLKKYKSGKARLERWSCDKRRSYAMALPRTIACGSRLSRQRFLYFREGGGMRQLALSD